MTIPQDPISATPGEQASPTEWLAARAGYEAFAASMSEWMPQPPAWETLSQRVRTGWLEAAKAARSH